MILLLVVDSQVKSNMIFTLGRGCRNLDGHVGENYPSHRSYRCHRGLQNHPRGREGEQVTLVIFISEANRRTVGEHERCSRSLQLNGLWVESCGVARQIYGPRQPLNALPPER